MKDILFVQCVWCSFQNFSLTWHSTFNLIDSFFNNPEVKPAEDGNYQRQSSKPVTKNFPILNLNPEPKLYVVSLQLQQQAVRIFQLKFRMILFCVLCHFLSNQQIGLRQVSLLSHFNKLQCSKNACYLINVYLHILNVM